MRQQKPLGTIVFITLMVIGLCVVTLPPLFAFIHEQIIFLEMRPPMYPQAEHIARTNQAQRQVTTFETSDPPVQVLEFYEAALGEQSWESERDGVKLWYIGHSRLIEETYTTGRSFDVEITILVKNERTFVEISESDGIVIIDYSPSLNP
jgi:hypothetical protein